MKTYQVEITGTMPLLMHQDNVEWADAMTAWKNDPGNRKKSVAGDDRTPAFRWLGSVYNDGEHVTLPSENLMKALMEGGAMVPVPGGRSGKTFKAQTQSGMMIGEAFWPLRVKGNAIPWANLEALTKEEDYAVHQKTAADLGFMLFLKRVKIGQSKHIRVRPRFDSWSASGTLNVWDEQLTLPVLKDIFVYAGKFKGLCDWRPSSPSKPGSFGMFEAKVSE